MVAKIIKIDPLKQSRAEKAFRRVYFILEDGSWAKTDIVPVYHNFKTWKPLLSLFDNGAVVFIEGAQLRRQYEVDGDSPVRYTDKRFEVIKSHEEKIIQESLL